MGGSDTGSSTFCFPGQIYVGNDVYAIVFSSSHRYM